MAITTTNMSLNVWDQLTDQFDHTALAENFQNIDEHDHTSGKGVTIPAGGLGTGSVGTTQLQNSSVTTAKLADGSVNSDKLGVNSLSGASLTDASITQAKLVSPTNSAYKVLFTGGGNYGTATAASGTYYPAMDNGVFIPTTRTVVGTGRTIKVMWLDPTWFDLSGGLTSKIRFNGHLAAGTTAPALGTVTLSMFRATTLSAGAPSGPTVLSAPTIATPASNAISHVTGSDVSLVAGYHWVEITHTTTATADARFSYSVELRNT